MVVDSGKAIDVMDAVAVEEVAMVEEEVVVLRIAPTTLVTVLIFKIFLGISAVPIEVLFMKTFRHMLSVNTSVQRLVADVVRTVHAGDSSVAEDNIFQKLILIGLTPAVEDVVAEDAEH